MVVRKRKREMVMVWLLTVAVLVGGGYLLQSHYIKSKTGSQGPPPGYVPESKRGPVVASLQADFKPVNQTNDSGSIIFKEVNGRVYLELDLSGDGAKGPMPTDIYHGTCKDPGMPLFSLSPVVDGKTENYISGTMADFKKKFPLAVHVHNGNKQTAAGIGKSVVLADVACADLVN